MTWRSETSIDLNNIYKYIANVVYHFFLDVGGRFKKNVIAAFVRLTGLQLVHKVHAYIYNNIDNMFLENYSLKMIY